MFDFERFIVGFAMGRDPDCVIQNAGDLNGVDTRADLDELDRVAAVSKPAGTADGECLGQIVRIEGEDLAFTVIID
ncbi:MAG: hypothetical protein ACREBK_04885, partial [Sphingomicrobium sp.]